LAVAPCAQRAFNWAIRSLVHGDDGLRRGRGKTFEPFTHLLSKLAPVFIFCLHDVFNYDLPLLSTSK
jgi:hypothetical protein